YQDVYQSATAAVTAAADMLVNWNNDSYQSTTAAILAAGGFLDGYQDFYRIDEYFSEVVQDLAESVNRRLRPLPSIERGLTMGDPRDPSTIPPETIAFLTSDEAIIYLEFALDSSPTISDRKHDLIRTFEGYGMGPYELALSNFLRLIEGLLKDLFIAAQVGYYDDFLLLKLSKGGTIDSIDVARDRAASMHLISPTLAKYIGFHALADARPADRKRGIRRAHVRNDFLHGTDRTGGSPHQAHAYAAIVFTLVALILEAERRPQLMN
ncbi:MAG: hypothetical protein ACRDHN_21925, partial [Thermomicrobiales bacterium]